jgi:GNAT superfamily N-acetyltransferase
MPPAAEYFIGTVGGELVCHIAACPSSHTGYYRLTRLVVMPEWQGAGVGTKFLEWVSEYHKAGRGRCNKELPSMFHTSHPQLIGYLNASKKWVLKSQQMFGGDKKRSGACLRKSALKSGSSYSPGANGFGGHFRAVQGFKYIGEK